MRILVMYMFLSILMTGLNLFADEAQAPHPFNVRDLVTMERISSEQVSPDGKTIVFMLRNTDLEANKGINHLWLIGVDGKNLKQLTSDPSGESSPVWSKDSRFVYFLSGRSGSSQVWKVAVEGGEAFQVTKQPLDVESYVLSPDNTMIAFSHSVYPCSTIEETLARMEENKKRKDSARVYTQLFIRHWDTWNDGTRSHIFVMPISDGTPVDIMKSMDADSPTKPFGDSGDYTFTPDSKGIVFTATAMGKAEAWTTNLDLFLASIDGQSAPVCLTQSNKALDNSPKFSPDGKSLAYLAMRRPGFEADRTYLMLRSWPEGEPRAIAESWDRAINSFTWSADGKTIYAIAEDIGQTPVFAIDIKTGKVTKVTGDGNVKAVSATKTHIIYSLDNIKSPVELYAMDIKTKKVLTLTSVNAKRLASIKMGDYQQFNFKGWNDETVYGFIVKPVDFDGSKKYPVAYLIHGGPQGSFKNEFHYRWNPQTYAGAGYAVVMVDFHGSTGYGQAFTDSISGDWGGKPLVDLQKGLEAALAMSTWMDAQKIGALGASYGGYMINWIAGNWPDRFRCLVCHDGNICERIAYYDTEELWFPEWEHKGTPWENPADYERHNPVNFVKNWKTPMLVIHGEKDYRVVYTQGISTFTALQRKGIESKLIIFPDENHWVLKPQNSIFWHDSVIEWLDKFLK